MSQAQHDVGLVLAEIARACQMEIPELPESAIVSVASLAGGTKARVLLARELVDKPDLLTSGRSDASPTAHKLIIGLRVLGFEKLQLPRCSVCGRAKALPHRDGLGGKRCGTCNKHATTPPCTNCGRVVLGGYRILDGAPYCKSCWSRDPRSHEKCISCGQARAPAVRTHEGPVCEHCYSAPNVACVNCGKLRPSVARREGHSLCISCYHSLRRYPRTCSRCGERRLAPYLSAEGPICRSCAGQGDLGRCAGCGSDQRRLNGVYCSVCTIPKFLRQLISDNSGAVKTELIKLERYLLRDPDRADAVLRWIQRSPMAQVVHEMAAGRTPISLRAVAEIPATGATGYFAALLMESGVVPTENFERVRLEVWEEKFFASLPNPANRKVLQRYAAWVVNPRFPNGGHLSTTNESTRHSQSKWHLIAVSDFLAAVNSAGFDLSTLPQRGFDEYVLEHGRKGKDLTPFIRWSKSQHLTKLRSEYPQYTLASPTLSEDERWSWVRDLLTADDVMLSSRVGGLISILYGTAVTRVVSLHCEAVKTRGNDEYLSLGTEPIKLPGAMGSLLRQLMNTVTSHQAEDPIWLFPGRRPGRHITPAALTSPLLERGINIRAAKNVALMTLSREMPASVLADFTGLNIWTAERWSALSGHTWAEYPRLRLPEEPNTRSR